MRTVLFSALAVAMLGTCGGVADAKTLKVAPGGDAQERLQAALIDAKPGDVVQLSSGRY
jgi:hypothetical protein